MKEQTPAQAANGRRTTTQLALKTMKPAPFRLSPDAYVAELRGESDRGAIILIATLIEDTLEGRLREEMQEVSEELVNSIFSGNGAGGSFSSKIALARSAGIVSAQMRQLIDHVRIVRNSAAHLGAEITFAEGPIRDAALALVDPQSRAIYANEARNVVRDMFMITCMHIQQITAGVTTVQSEKVRAAIDQDGSIPFALMYLQ